MRKLILIASLISGIIVAALGVSPGESPIVHAVGCADYNAQVQAQNILRAAPHDPLGLDPDRNGIACEDLPCPCDRSPVQRTGVSPTVPGGGSLTPTLGLGATATPTVPGLLPTQVLPLSPLITTTPAITATVPVPVDAFRRYFSTTPDGEIETCPAGDEEMWRILYWQGPPAPVVTAIAACPAIDRVWVSQTNRWLGYSTKAGAGNDQFFLNNGEAVFTHSGPGSGATRLQ